MLKKLLLAGAAVGFSSAALANPPHWAPAHGWRAQQHYYPAYRPAYRPVYVYPAYRPVYVVPRAVYAPVYPVAPAYPIGPGISIRLNFPL